jgi:hypothetical protein
VYIHLLADFVPVIKYIHVATQDKEEIDAAPASHRSMPHLFRRERTAAAGTIRRVDARGLRRSSGTLRRCPDSGRGALLEEDGDRPQKRDERSENLIPILPLETEKAATCKA